MLWIRSGEAKEEQGWENEENWAVREDRRYSAWIPAGNKEGWNKFPELSPSSPEAAVASHDQTTQNPEQRPVMPSTKVHFLDRDSSPSDTPSCSPILIVSPWVCNAPGNTCHLCIYDSDSVLFVPKQNLRTNSDKIFSLEQPIGISCLVWSKWNLFYFPFSNTIKQIVKQTHKQQK